MEVEISQKVAAIPGTGRQAVPVTSKALAVLSQEMHLDFKGPKQKNLGKVLTLLPELCSVSGGFSSPSRSYMEKPLCLVETPGVSSRNTCFYVIPQAMQPHGLGSQPRTVCICKCFPQG